MGNFPNLLKKWYVPTLALFAVIVFAGIGFVKAQDAATIEPAPPAVEDRQTKEVAGRAATDSMLQGGVQVLDSNVPQGAPGTQSQPLPKFSGLNVTGPILNKGDVPLIFYDDAMFYGLTDVRNGLTNSAAPAGARIPVTIHDNLKIAGSGNNEPGDLIVRGRIVGARDLYPNLTLATTTVDGSLVVNNAILGNNGVDPLVVSGPGGLNVMGQLSVSANAAVSGNLNVSGSSNLGTIVIGTAASNKNLTVNGNVTVEGTADSPGLYVHGGGASVDAVLSAERLHARDSLFVSGNSSLNDVNLRGDIYKNIRNDINPVTIADGLIVNGKVTAAGGFGKYTRRASAAISVLPGSSGSQSASCQGREVIISCGATGGNDFLLKYLYPDNNLTTCYGRGKNEGAIASNFSVYAVCFDPNS